MDQNRIKTDGFSNDETRRLYEQGWPSEPELKARVQNGGQGQCGGCSFFAPFNEDWGLCCNRASRHHYETVFEHFTCPSLVPEGWGPHSFTAIQEFHCFCHEERGDLDPSLDGTSQMLRWAFPEGLPEEDYLPLIASLHEHMSHRGLAEVLANLFGREYIAVLNDTGKVTQVGPAAIERVRAKLDPAGFQCWLKDEQ